MQKLYCVAPWTHFHLKENGKGAPCCVGTKHEFDLDHNKKPQSILDNSTLEQVRQEIRSGKIPNFCIRCRSLERSGLNSPRDYFNSNFHIKDIDQTNIESIDIRFSNLCNFKCRTCGPFASTSWYSDYFKLRGTKFNHSVRSNLFGSQSKIEHWLRSLSTTLKEAHFSGGEPLLMKEHFWALKYFSSELKHVKLRYNTNLSTLTFRGNDYIPLWRSLKEIQLDVSVDGWGKQGMYIRKGLIWHKFLNNLKRVSSEVPNLKINISCTVSLLNILHLPNLFKKLDEELGIDPKNVILNPVKFPLRYSSLLLNTKQKNLVKDFYQIKASNLREEFRLKLDHFLEWLFKHSVPAGQQGIEAFLIETKKLDIIRNEHFFTVFPDWKLFLQD